MQRRPPTMVDADAVVVVDQQVRPYPFDPRALRVCDRAISRPTEGDACLLAVRRLLGRGGLIGVKVQRSEAVARRSKRAGAKDAERCGGARAMIGTWLAGKLAFFKTLHDAFKASMDPDLFKSRRGFIVISPPFCVRAGSGQRARFRAVRRSLRQAPGGAFQQQRTFDDARASATSSRPAPP